MINNFYVLLSLLVSQITGLLKYDKGTITGFSECKDGNIQTKTVNFNGAFAVVPQIILSLEMMDMYKGADYRMILLNLQTTGFQLQINCLTSIPVHALTYYWYAIDDQRIQVINNFNMVSPDDKTFNHNNPNALYGFVTLTSVGILNEINFKIFISSITTTKVTVSVTKDPLLFVNLQSIGYQIVLGTEEVFAAMEVLYHTSYYSSGQLTQYPNKWLLLGYNGFNFGNNLRSRSVRTSQTQSYIIETWYGAYNKNYHLKCWIAYQFTIVYTAFECLTLRISSSLDLEVSLKPKIFLEINELTQSYSSSTSLFIDKAINLLNMKIYMKCTKTKTISSKFLRCQTCTTKKYYQFSHYCHGAIDAVSYFPRLNLVQSVYKELQVNILENRITITQVLYNQVQSIETLLDIQVLNP